jgi:hypothetical protein
MTPVRLRTVFHAHINDPLRHSWWIETLFVLVALSVRYDMHALVHKTWAYGLYYRAVYRKQNKMLRAYYKARLPLKPHR